MDKKPIVIIGSGGHAKTVLDTALCTNNLVAGFLSNNMNAGELLNGTIVLGGDKLLEDVGFLASHRFIIGIGGQAHRSLLHASLIKKNATFATLIHPSCVVSEFSNIGGGTLLAAGSIVNSNTRIRQSCILNTACSVDHDCELDDLCQISPGARLAGTVTCGEGAFIGVGAVVLPSINIGVGAIVGGGAVVTRNVAENKTVVGNPAQIKF